MIGTQCNQTTARQIARRAYRRAFRAIDAGNAWGAIQAMRACYGLSVGPCDDRIDEACERVRADVRASGRADRIGYRAAARAIRAMAQAWYLAADDLR